MSRNVLLVLGAALTLTLAACSSSSTTSKNSAATGGGTVVSTATSGASRPAATAGGIVISGFAYSGTLTVKPGEKVTVTNKDSVAHTLTDKKNHKFDTGTVAGNGGTATFTAPTTPGTYQFGCTFHASMQGTLVVRG